MTKMCVLTKNDVLVQYRPRHMPIQLQEYVREAKFISDYGRVVKQLMQNWKWF